MGRTIGEALLGIETTLRTWFDLFTLRRTIGEALLGIETGG